MVINGRCIPPDTSLVLIDDHWLQTNDAASKKLRIAVADLRDVSKSVPTYRNSRLHKVGLVRSSVRSLVRRGGVLAKLSIKVLHLFHGFFVSGN